MNEFAISKRMITITIDEDLFNDLYDAVINSDEISHDENSEAWKFMFKIYEELHG